MERREAIARPRPRGAGYTARNGTARCLSGGSQASNTPCLAVLEPLIKPVFPVQLTKQFERSSRHTSRGDVVEWGAGATYGMGVSTWSTSSPRSKKPRDAGGDSPPGLRLTNSDSGKFINLRAPPRT